MFGFLNDIAWWLCHWWLYLAGVLFTVSLLTYFVPFLVAAMLPVANLKKRYNAKWAIVTGGSSGIGLSLATKLAEQGLNVIIAALDDDLLQPAVEGLCKKFKDQEFISVPVNLAKDGYIEDIKAAIGDRQVQVSNLGASASTAATLAEHSAPFLCTDCISECRIHRNRLL